MRFSKLHGLGNDFILLDLRGPEAGMQAPLAQAEAVRLCDRHQGIGADGVLTLLPAPAGEARLLIQNSDGSVPEMCGNGARCAALWVITQGCTRPGEGRIVLHTDAGPRPCVVSATSATLGEVEVEMGAPRVGARRTFPVGGRALEAMQVSMGNPHLVFFDAASGAQARGALSRLAAAEGPALCASESANIEFVARVEPQRYQVAVWERGAGLTQACGTGACAVAAAALARGEADARAPIAVELPGGTLHIRLDAATGELRMRGPAQLVFRGAL
ncbi:MAG: diaminopimelate epimerase [Myxococcales bacterium]